MLTSPTSAGAAPLHSQPSRPQSGVITITGICTGSRRVVAKDPVLAAMIGRFGLEGDRHGTETVVVRGGPRRGTVIFNERQWTAISEEELAEVERSLGVSLPLGVLGENFRCSGLPDLSHLPFGTRLCFPSGAVLIVSGQNFPCRKQSDYLADTLACEAARRGFMPAAKERRGIIGWVERTGPVAVGERVVVEPPG